MKQDQVQFISKSALFFWAFGYFSLLFCLLTSVQDRTSHKVPVAGECHHITFGKYSEITQMLPLVVPIPRQFIFVGSGGPSYGCGSCQQVLGDVGMTREEFEGAENLVKVSPQFIGA